jgi:histidinol phosphatase-like PHP family hydrolase
LLVLNTDTHGPQDLTSLEMARKIAIGAGLSPREVDRMFKNSENLVKKVWKDKVPQQRVKKNRFQNTK